MKDLGGLIDLFTLALTHGLILLTLWRLLFRPELDVEDTAAAPRRPWLRGERSSDEKVPGDA
jgi:hypothetical protein